MLYDYHNCDQWNRRLGGELELPWSSRDVVRKRLTSEDLNYHYLKYRYRIEEQNWVIKDDNAKIAVRPGYREAATNRYD